ncbi:MAG: TatD family hydrolase [Acidimicrobiales bacterium]
MWFDSHCHLDYEGMDPEALTAAAAAGVGRLVCVGTDVDTSAGCIRRAQDRPEMVWATAGIHPHEASRGVAGLAGLLDSPEVVAVGECGLDYHYNHSPPEAQRPVFAAQVALAAARDLTLVIHTRNAWDDTFAALDDAVSAGACPGRIVFHCFTGGPAEAERALATGAWLSFSGIITFPRADEIREAAALAPSDRILVETDAPFLTPVPHRGRTNSPAHVALVGAEVARVRGVEAHEIEALTWLNGHNAFGRCLPDAAMCA